MISDGTNIISVDSGGSLNVRAIIDYVNNLHGALQ